LLSRSSNYITYNIRIPGENHISYGNSGLEGGNFSVIKAVAPSKAKLTAMKATKRGINPPGLCCLCALVPIFAYLYLQYICTELCMRQCTYEMYTELVAVVPLCLDISGTALGELAEHDLGIWKVN
jgi:hypothetical protein